MSAVQILSANEIYKTYVAPHNTPENTTGFKEWLSIEKIAYRNEAPKSDFDRYLNLKYRRRGFGWWGYFCAEGEKDKFVTKNQEAINNLLTLAAPIVTSKLDEPKKEEEIPEVKKRIAGMPPLVTYGLGALVLISLATVIIVAIKKSRKKKQAQE
jgi:hypothetical protein